MNDNGIILRCPNSKGPPNEFESLAYRLAELGVNILGTLIRWPRDSLLVHPDGRYMSPSSLSHYDHEAFAGGRFFKGPDFAICSDTLPTDKREGTERETGLKFHYYDLRPAIEKLQEVPVEGQPKFYTHYQHDPHMDVVLALRNPTKRIFTYEHPAFINIAEQIAKDTGYTVATVPFEEAKYAGIGFLQTPNLVVVDCRAVQTIETLLSLGEPVIATPEPMRDTNQKIGGLRCVYTELPFPYSLLRFNPEIKEPCLGNLKSMFFNLAGHELLENGVNLLAQD